MYRNLALATGVAAAVLAAMPASAGTLDAVDGIRYRLESQATADPLTREFALVITRHNTAFDTQFTGGDFRTGINSIAFGDLSSGVVASGTMITPPAGYTFSFGGLNSGGCNGSGNFYCFDNTAIPPIPVNALPTTPIIFVFSVTLSSGNFNGYLDADTVNDAEDPAFKIDWVGTKNNYDLVSVPIDVESICPDCTPTTTSVDVPEPATLALLGLGLLGLGGIKRLRPKS